MTRQWRGFLLHSPSMLTILAVETATQACSVALIVNGERRYARFIVTNNAHTQHILPMINSVLQEAGCLRSDLQAIAVGHGPGSFTGVRLAVSVAQALGFALNIPVYPVSTLECLAYAVDQSESLQENTVLIPALDARMQQCTLAVYQKEGGMLVPRLAPCLTSIEFLLEQAVLYRDKGYPVMGIGSGWDLVEADRSSGILLYPDPYPRAECIAEIAFQLWQQGNQGLPAEQVLPLYLREKVAEKAQRWDCPTE